MGQQETNKRDERDESGDGASEHRGQKPEFEDIPPGTPESDPDGGQKDERDPAWRPGDDESITNQEVRSSNFSLLPGPREAC